MLDWIEWPTFPRLQRQPSSSRDLTNSLNRHERSSTLVQRSQSISGRRVEPLIGSSVLQRRRDLEGIAVKFLKADRNGPTSN